MTDHPWTILDGWQKKALKKGIKAGTTRYDQYYTTLEYMYRNNYKVPTVAGYIILATFLLLVCLATFRNICLQLFPSWRKEKKLVERTRVHLTQAPLFHSRHAKPFFNGSWVSVHAPLRGQALLLLGLFLFNVVPLAAFYNPYDPALNQNFPDAYSQYLRCIIDKAGILATSQIPLVILFSGRNNPVSFLTGCSFSTSMLYHRWIARVIFIQVLIHSIGYTIYGFHTGGFAKYEGYWEEVYFRWGVVAVISICILTFFSLRYLRQKSYEAFVAVHFVGAILVMVGIHQHIHLLEQDSRYGDFLDYIWASIAFYVFDKIMRMARIIAFSTNGFGCRHLSTLQAGHHVMLWIPTCQPVGAHPFTVAEIIADEQGGPSTFVVYAKIYDGVTKRIANRVKAASNGVSSMTILVEGFYGGHEDTTSYDNQLLVAGGIGITHCLSYFLEAIQLSRPSHLVWIVNDLSITSLPLDALRRNLQSASANSFKGDEKGRPSLQFTLLYSRSASTIDSSSSSIQLASEEESMDDDIVDEKESTQEEKQFESYRALEDQGLQFHFEALGRRPDLHQLLQDNLEKEAASKTMLLSCGPAELCDSLREAAQSHRMPYFEEPFGW